VVEYISRFLELGQNINQLVLSLVTNDTLCKLLYYNVPDPLSQPSVPSPSTDVLFNNLFPYPYSPIAETNEISLLNVYLDNFRPEKVKFKESLVICDVVCHQELWQLTGSSNGLRPYLIMNEIDDMFNQQDYIIGIGKMQFNSARVFFPAGIESKFCGYQLTYKILDFN